MKILHVTCIALSFVTLLSCSKDKEVISVAPVVETPVPAPPVTNESNGIIGTWMARLYKEGKSTPVLMEFRIKEDGVFEVMDIATKQIGVGQWIIVGNKFEASCTIYEQIKSFFFKGDMNGSFDRSGGMWGYDDKTSYIGDWDMSK